jgi:outer membrane murein-binding lipoprotein Lpp
MDLIEKLEGQFEKLSLRIRRLEDENSRLRAEIEAARQQQGQITERVDRLLKKMQEVDID